MEEYMIEARHISCKIGHRYLLHDITWQVRPGEHWVVFGMNGCGKTTLLSIIAGFQRYTAGELKILGEELTGDNLLALRKRIGWVSSSFFDKCYSRESAVDIVLSGKFGTLGLDEGITLEDRKLAKQLLEELHLEGRVNYTFDMLSKGERQNVLIARALFSRPDILVLDEPCTGLDIYNRQYLFETIDALAARKRLTIIYVTHYAEEISALFDRCLLLKNGRIFAQGATEALFRQEILSELLGYSVAIERENDQTRRIKVLGVQSQAANFL